jgi:prevent-host-death family protein
VVRFAERVFEERAMSSTAFDITTRLADLVEAAGKDGPQVLSKDGVETAVLISINDWKLIRAGETWKLRLPEDASKPSMKDPLLDPDGPHDIYIPPRGRYKHRPPMEFE